MGKFLALLLCLYPIFFHAQEKKSSYRQGSLGVHTRINGVSVFSSANITYTTPISMTVIDIYTQKRREKGYTPLAQLLFSAPLNAKSPNFPNNPPPGYGIGRKYLKMYDIFRWGLLLGGSTRIASLETPQGIGWSIFLNGGVFTDIFNIIGIRDGDTPRGEFLVGAELDLRVINRFAPYCAFTFGFNFGFALATGKSLFTEPLILYGASLGFLF